MDLINSCSMDNSIYPSLQKQFQSEQFRRAILECQDVDLLREIALELLELNKKNTFIAQWASRNAFQAEQANLLRD